MKKGLIIGLSAVLCVFMSVAAVFADWKEAGRDKWRVIYVDEEIVAAGPGTFLIREKKEYISEGPRCSCTPQEVITSYSVDSATCKVQSYEMKALDEDGNVMMARTGGETTPEVSLAPYCTIALVKAEQEVEARKAAPNPQFASASFESAAVEPIRP